MIEEFITIIIGYLVGCIQTSYFLAKIVKKTDIRSLGNGNAGASNTTVVFGWKYGIFVGLIDIIKPIIAIVLIQYLWVNEITIDELTFLKFLGGFFVILGHNFPFFMGFKGGKGTASLIGMIIAIDSRIAMIGIIAIVLITIVTDYIALGTMALVISIIITTTFFGYTTSCIAITILIAIMSIYKHIPNMIRIKNHTETGLRKTLKK